MPAVLYAATQAILIGLLLDSLNSDRYRIYSVTVSITTLVILGTLACLGYVSYHPNNSSNFGIVEVLTAIYSQGTLLLFVTKITNLVSGNWFTIFVPLYVVLGLALIGSFGILARTLPDVLLETVKSWKHAINSRIMCCNKTQRKGERRNVHEKAFQQDNIVNQGRRTGIPISVANRAEESEMGDDTEKQTNRSLFFFSLALFIISAALTITVVSEYQQLLSFPKMNHSFLSQIWTAFCLNKAIPERDGNKIVLRLSCIQSALTPVVICSWVCIGLWMTVSGHLLSPQIHTKILAWVSTEGKQQENNQRQSKTAKYLGAGRRLSSLVVQGLVLPPQATVDEDFDMQDELDPELQLPYDCQSVSNVSIHHARKCSKQRSPLHIGVAENNIRQAAELSPNKFTAEKSFQAHPRRTKAKRLIRIPSGRAHSKKRSSITSYLTGMYSSRYLTGLDNMDEGEPNERALKRKSNSSKTMTENSAHRQKLDSEKRRMTTAR